ncbi:hypothetical protein HU200_066199 [Digitaria exilis]|uniref:Uncharacterized protein n=1 Tax=Digitaria exilis TaxID=1010633 RepID=A0A835A2J4_9POAL|nr:hypothetical protein HU200_066199 [Digitaria exilis]
MPLLGLPSGFRPLPRNGRGSTVAGFIMVLRSTTGDRSLSSSRSHPDCIDGCHEELPAIFPIFEVLGQASVGLLLWFPAIGEFATSGGGNGSFPFLPSGVGGFFLYPGGLVAGSFLHPPRLLAPSAGVGASFFFLGPHRSGFVGSRLRFAEEAVILTAAPIPEDAKGLHGYKHLVPSGDDLRFYLRPKDLTWGCPWETIHALRDHVVGQATSMALREDYKKKWNHHRRLARNMRWSLPGQH